MSSATPYGTSQSSNTDGLSPCCLSGKLHEGTPAGKESKLGDLKAYVTGDEKNKSKTLLFITDIFGYDLNNARLLADEYAAAGFYVVVPDVLEGDNIDHNLLNAIAPKPSMEKSLTEKATDTAKVGATLPTWLARNREAVTRPKIDACVNALRADSQVGKIGAVGFCWGARYAILLTHKDASPQVDAAVGNHPSFLAVPKEIEPIAKPVLINVGDADAMMGENDIVKTKEVFLKDVNNVPNHVNVYKGAGHGFAVRADLDVGEERKQKEDAASATIDWFKKHLA